MSSSQNGSDPLRPHPHAGARDAEGNYGYVADATLVRRWMINRFRHWKATSVTSITSASTGNSHALLRQFLPFDDEKRNEGYLRHLSRQRIRRSSRVSTSH